MVTEVALARPQGPLRAALMGAFAGSLSGAVGAWLGAALLVARTAVQPADLGSAPTTVVGMLATWLFLAAALSIWFARLALPAAVLIGFVAGALWCGRGTRAVHAGGTILGATVGAGVWLAVIEQVFGQASFEADFGPAHPALHLLPGLVSGAAAGWLYATFLRRTTDWTEVPWVPAPRRLLRTEATGGAGGVVGALVLAVSIFADPAARFDPGYWLPLLARAAIAGGAFAAPIGGLIGVLGPRRFSAPSRAFIAVTACVAALAWIVPHALDELEPTWMAATMMLSLILAPLLVGFGTTWWLMSRPDAHAALGAGRTPPPGQGSPTAAP